MNADNIQYVVLRWFEQLPILAAGKDMNLLVHSDDLPKLNKYFTKKKHSGAIPYDIYSSNGMEGYDYSGLPYYPIRIAESIILNRVLLNGTYYVPCPNDYFHSLAFHVVYHKAENSGIPISTDKKASIKHAEHNYVEIIKKLARKNGIKIEITLSSLHRYLTKKKWTPGIGMIRKLGLKKRWLSTLFPPMNSKQIQGGELILYLVGDWVHERNLTDFIVNFLDKKGLDILLTHPLDAHSRNKAKREILGESYGKGSSTISEGDPAVLIVAYDHHPLPVLKKDKQLYPFVANRHFFLTDKLRKILISHLPSGSKINPLHSSYDGLEAWAYLQIVCPKLVSHVKSLIRTHTSSYRTNEPVLKKFDGFKNRGKVEVVVFKRKQVVKKTFMPSKERFLKREKFAYQVLSKMNPCIPPLISSGENYIMIPFYDNLIIDRNKRSKIIKDHKIEIRQFLKLLYDQGWAHTDFHPGNILVTKKNSIKFIDFEFLYRYKAKPATFWKSYDIVGIPADFDGDIPNGYISQNNNDSWIKQCGYSLIELLK